MKVLIPEDRLDFGKNKGLLLSEVYHYQPSYLEWAILNIPSFKINIEEFESLPNPTPWGYKKDQFSGEKPSLELSEETIYEILENTDTTNHSVNVYFIKEEVAKKAITLDPVNYRFPKRIVEINSKK